jgi:hypothetical protein
MSKTPSPGEAATSRLKLASGLSPVRISSCRSSGRHLPRRSCQISFLPNEPLGRAPQRVLAASAVESGPVGKGPTFTYVFMHYRYLTS